ncbi:predicted protein [Sclerotinia sclerotiorum 1980 UF-70]|uniref:Uncharacterized protein n=1 Tax=Sclerotinia sclerotiorum (strain ATCC 18683 / 1980 / Ss-1) TaxID=665079 RepID=A7EAI7_SCLS1|nr:predicted protein [Sclerotinia sclerotiorum 1980 UF-70]EDN99465.1 predicted protein [Sclerotinia sclerotiorum 1980 UF-70]
MSIFPFIDFVLSEKFESNTPVCPPEFSGHRIRQVQPVSRQTPRSSSICYSGIDACDYCDGDHCSRCHRIARDTSVSPTRCPRLLRFIATLSQSLQQYLLDDRDRGDLPLASSLYDMTWPMEEMPHDDVVSFRLIALLYCTLGLICNEKDRFLPDMAMADNDLYENGNIAGSSGHPTDRIRNAGVDRIDHKPAGCTEDQLAQGAAHSRTSAVLE